MFMKNNFKFLFLIMTILSTLFLISSNSWYNLWIWLEINLMSFISFLINNKNKLSVESSLIYFLIQSISSSLFLFSIFLMIMYKKFIFLMMISIMIKISSAPFHFWLPLIIESMSWMKIFILITWQKIIPLIILIYNNFKFNLMMFTILSMLIGTISGLNYSSLKKMISFSSINQLSWMFLSLINSKLFTMFIIIYIYMMWMIIKSMELFDLKYLNQMFNLKLKNKFIKLFLFVNFLSLGGLPPLLGFFPKLFIIMKMNNMIIFMMLLFSLISLFMYMRIIFSMLMLNSMKINIISMKKNMKKFYILIKLNIINNFILIIMFF